MSKKILRRCSVIGILISGLTLLFWCLPHAIEPVLRFRDEVYEIEQLEDKTVYTHELNRITLIEAEDSKTISFDLAWLSKRTYTARRHDSRVRVTDQDGKTVLIGDMRDQMLYDLDGEKNLEYSLILNKPPTGNTMYEKSSKLPPCPAEALALAQGEFDGSRKWQASGAPALFFLFIMSIFGLASTYLPRPRSLFEILTKRIER